MADSSLDDFFAKKDKSKKKGKAKFTTSDILNQQKEEPKKPADKPVKKKEDKPPPAPQPDSGDKAESEENPTVKGIVSEDDDWKEYVEEEKDYSGLRIQNMQIVREDQEESEENQQEEGEEGEEGKREGGSQSGPWKMQDIPQPAPPPPVEEPKQELPKEPEGAVKAGKYIPPGMRAAMQNSASPAPLTPMRIGQRQRKTAPNIQSEEDFPTLGGGVPAVDSVWGGSGGRFEKVKSGGRQTDDPSNTRTQLQLGNKFDALRD